MVPIATQPTAVEPAPDGVGHAEWPRLEVDSDGIIYAVNDAFCALLLCGRDELVGRPVLEITHPDDRQASVELRRQIKAASAQRQVLEKRYCRGDGVYVWVRLVVTKDSASGRMVGQVVEISDLVAARDQAHRSTRRLDALIMNSTDVIAVLDGEGRLLAANPAAARLFGWHTSGYVGGCVFDLVHPDDLVELLVSFAKMLETPMIVSPLLTFRVSTAAGAWLHLEATGSNQLGDPAVLGVVVNAHDVTDRVLRAQESEQSRAALAVVLARVTEFRDPYTAGHQDSVAILASAIAAALGLSAADQSVLRIGAQLHDIGKIAVPAEILTKPGRLTDIEFGLVAMHPRVGFEVLRDATLPPEVLDVVLHHHERLDGSGYPDALAGEQIGLFARIVAVADVVDAMASHRPYRPSLGLEAARAELEANGGRLYDASVVDAALTLPALQVPA